MRKRKGFTIAELLIAMTILAFVGMLSSIIFVNVTRYNKKLSLERTLYADARYIMSKVEREIQRNTIDYEEYYNKLVLNGQYSDNYGDYANMFYDYGDPNPRDPENKGAVCKSIIDGSAASEGPPCDTDAGYFLDKKTLDTNIGENPIGDPSSENAFCDNPVDCAKNNNLQDELYLINADGSKKTMLGRERINKVFEDDHFALSMVQMDGVDSTGDGKVDTWICADGYNCIGQKVLDPEGEVYDAEESYPRALDLSLAKAGYLDRYTDFVPISPIESNIVNLKFIVAPLEDPRKAFNERTDDIQIQPYVTVLLTVEPSADENEGYFGEIPPVTFQSIVSTRIYNEVESF